MDMDKETGMFDEYTQKKFMSKDQINRVVPRITDEELQARLDKGERGIPKMPPYTLDEGIVMDEARLLNRKIPSDIKDDFKSGAKSSGKMPRFDLIPRSFLKRIADRFQIGADKYPPFNYRKGFTDKEYILDRINHLQNHLQAFLNPQTVEEFTDDNLAGIGWAVAFLMECQTTLEGRNSINEIVAERSKHIIKHIGIDGIDFIE